MGAHVTKLVLVNADKMDCRVVLHHWFAKTTVENIMKYTLIYSLEISSENHWRSFYYLWLLIVCIDDLVDDGCKDVLENCLKTCGGCDDDGESTSKPPTVKPTEPTKTDTPPASSTCPIGCRDEISK